MNASNAKLTDGQLRRIQTLWGLIWGRFGSIPSSETKAKASRDARLAYISSKIGRQIGSAKELTQGEAKLAIDAMQGALPAELVHPPSSGRRRTSAGTARAYGTAGRKGYRDKEIRLPDAETFRLLDHLLGELGWDRARLDAFLRSPKSPVRGGSPGEGGGRKIRTLADANRIIWVLKGMLRRRAVAISTSHASRALSASESPVTNHGSLP